MLCDQTIILTQCVAIILCKWKFLQMASANPQRYQSPNNLATTKNVDITVK